MSTIIHVDSVDSFEATVNDLSANLSGVFICTSGRAEIEFCESTCIVSADMLLYYTPYSMVKVISASDDWGGIMLGEELEVVLDTMSDVPVTHRIAMRDFPCIRISETEKGRIMQMIDIVGDRKRMLEEQKPTKGRAVHTAILEALVKALCLDLIAIYFACTPQEDIPAGTESRIHDRFMVSVLTNAMTERSVTYYAAEQNLSPGHFSSIVKSISGITPLKWIEKVAMVKAKKLLSDRSLSTKQVAKMMHFPDQSAFGRYFKKHEHVSPGAYRKRRFAGE